MALEAAKEEAEYHAAAKQRFLANMSHELRTPLQSIIGYSEQLKQDQPEGDTKVDAIYQSSEHLLQIVNEILAYSRIPSCKLTLNEKPFAASGLISSRSEEHTSELKSQMRISSAAFCLKNK